MVTPSFYSSLLNEDPRLSYYGLQNLWGQTPGQRRFYQNAFDLLNQQYLGQLGRMIMQGQEPNLMPQDFFSQFNYPQFYQQQGGLRRPANLSPFARFRF